jgi:hypothetical protein
VNLAGQVAFGAVMFIGVRRLHLRLAIHVRQTSIIHSRRAASASRRSPVWVGD